MTNENQLPFDPSKVPDLINQGEIKVISTPPLKPSVEPSLPANEAMGEEMEKAKEIMGLDFFGPDQVEKAFGFKIDRTSLPKMRFTPQELTKAKANNQYLMLYAPKKADGTPITAKMLIDTLQPQFDREGKGKIQSDFTDWSEKEKFYTTETPRTAWRLITKNIIPGSLKHNYLQQTEDIVKYLKRTVFNGRSLPPDYKEAIEEFEEQKKGLKKNISDMNDDREVDDKLAGLKLTQMTRQTFVEDRYSWLVYFQNRNERLFENKYNWTSSQASGGSLVGVGGKGTATKGAYVRIVAPYNSTDGQLGVVVSR
jgi:hypothetical protein